MNSPMPTARSVGVDAIFQYTGTGVQLFSGMIFYIIIVRLFSTSAVGAIALFLAIVGLFNVVFSFGLGTAAQHFTSYNIGRGDFAAVRKTFYKIVAFSFLLAALGFFTLFILSGNIAFVFLHSYSYTKLVELLSIVLFGNILFGILNGLLLGMQNFRLSALINVAIWIIYYFGSIILALFVRDLNVIILGWATGMFVGVFVLLVSTINMIRRFGGSGKAVQNQTLFKYTLPVLFSSIITYGSVYIDRFVVAGLLNLSALGIYNFALLISSSIGFLAIPFNNILMPKFSEFYAKGSISSIAKNVESSSLLLSSIYIPASLGIAALSPMIIDLLGGKHYMAGTIPLFIVMISSGAFITQNILVQALASVRRTHLFMISSLVALATNIAFSVALIPVFGLIGAALGFSSVFATTFLVLYYFATKEKLASFDTVGMSKVWVASIVMFLIVFALQDKLGHSIYLLPIYILIGSLAYFALARILKFFKLEGREMILSIFPERYRFLKRVLTTLLLT